MPFKGTRKSQVPMRGWGHKHKFYEPTHRVNMPQRQDFLCSATPHLHRLNRLSAHYFVQRRGIVIAPFQHDDLDCLARECHVSFRSASLVLCARLPRHHQSAKLDLIM